MKPKCEDCYYWEYKLGELESGACQKVGTCHRWPEELDKFGNDWCGEFKSGKFKCIKMEGSESPEF